MQLSPDNFDGTEQLRRSVYVAAIEADHVQREAFEGAANAAGHFIASKKFIALLERGNISEAREIVASLREIKRTLDAFAAKREEITPGRTAWQVRKYFEDNHLSEICDLEQGPINEIVEYWSGNLFWQWAYSFMTDEGPDKVYQPNGPDAAHLENLITWAEVMLEQRTRIAENRTAVMQRLWTRN